MLVDLGQQGAWEARGGGEVEGDEGAAAWEFGLRGLGGFTSLDCMMCYDVLSSLAPQTSPANSPLVTDVLGGWIWV